MQNLANSNLNLIRHYSFTFYNVTGGGPFTVTPIPQTIIQDSFNFSFSYSVTNNILNTAKFTFYNLSQATVGLFSSTQNRRGFIFNTWYANDTVNSVALFNGLTYTVNTYRQGADIITEVVGCDVFLNLLYKGIAQSFPAGTSYLTVVQTLLNYYGNIGNLNSISNQYLTGVYTSPKVFRGQLITILKKIASDAGLIFSIQLNTITMIPKSLSITTSNVIQMINSQTGLVGYVRAEALSTQLFPVTYFNNQNLNSNLSILSISTLMKHYNLYDKIYLQSEFFTGNYGILSISHNGEWRQNQWYTSLKLWPDTSS